MRAVQWRQGATSAGVCALLLSIVAVACALPVEDGIAVLVCVFFFGAGVLGLSFTRDERQRSLLVRLFVAAFLIRLVFTLLAYGLDLISVIGGADDVGWGGGWEISRFWRGYVNAPPNIKNMPGMRPPLAFVEVLDDAFGRNRGWYFYIAYFFELIDTRSQISVAFINNFLSSLTACVIFRATRDYFSEKAALLAAGAAVIFPGFIAWSALTIKEPWLIFLEIFVFYLTWTAVRDRRWFLLAPALLLVLVTYSMRFYIGYVMLLAVPFMFIGTRAANPRKTALQVLGALGLAFVLGTAMGFIKIDVIGIVEESMASLSTFRENTSGGTRSTGGSTPGVNSGIDLPYDPTTPLGVLQLTLHGMAYLLLSPFPWALSGKQLLTLPDVAIWWALVFGFILPGLRYAWQRQPGLSIAITAYLAPLVLVYSFSFGNIGLAYRQRAQLMPFFLFFAAAGYDARRKKRKEQEADPPTRPNAVDDILRRLRETAAATPSAPTATVPQLPPAALAPPQSEPISRSSQQ